MVHDGQLRSNTVHLSPQPCHIAVLAVNLDFQGGDTILPGLQCITLAQTHFSEKQKGIYPAGHHIMRMQICFFSFPAMAQSFMILSDDIVKHRVGRYGRPFFQY